MGVELNMRWLRAKISLLEDEPGLVDEFYELKQLLNEFEEESSALNKPTYDELKIEKGASPTPLSVRHRKINRAIGDLHALTESRILKQITSANASEQAKVLKNDFLKLETQISAQVSQGTDNTILFDRSLKQLTNFNMGVTKAQQQQTQENFQNFTSGEQTLALIDVDRTLVGDKNQLNRPLLAALKAANIKDICLFTNMSLSGISAKTVDPDYMSRADLVSKLTKDGFNVLRIITPADPNMKKGLGAAYSTLYHPENEKYFDKKGKRTPAKFDAPSFGEQQKKFRAYKNKSEEASEKKGFKTEKGGMFSYFMIQKNRLKKKYKQVVLFDDANENLEAAWQAYFTESRAKEPPFRFTTVHVKQADFKNTSEAGSLFRYSNALKDMESSEWNRVNYLLDKIETIGEFKSNSVNSKMLAKYRKQLETSKEKMTMTMRKNLSSIKTKLETTQWPTKVSTATISVNDAEKRVPKNIAALHNKLSEMNMNTASPHQLYDAVQDVKKTFQNMASSKQTVAATKSFYNTLTKQGVTSEPRLSNKSVSRRSPPSRQ